METRRSEWEEEKDYTAEQFRSMALNNYNNLLTSGRWSTKDPKYACILSLVEVVQNLADELESNTSNNETTKWYPDYIRYLPPCMLEEPKSVVGNQDKNGK